RAVIYPDKVTTAQWLQVHDTAHRVGLRSNNTIMYGHVDGPVAWGRHLVAVREHQKASGGFTEFVPLPFVPMEAPIFLKGRARRGSGRPGTATRGRSRWRARSAPRRSRRRGIRT